MQAEGVTFKTGTHIGVDIDAKDLKDEYDALLIATGAEKPRDLPIPGRDLEGVYFAMQFLPQQNRRLGGRPVEAGFDITAKDKHVIIIGAATRAPIVWERHADKGRSQSASSSCYPSRP